MLRPDSWECNFVLGDGGGHEVHVHSYVLNDKGDNVYGVEYQSAHLTGTGSIAGYSVKCMAPEWLVKFHSGYELDENDRADVRALCHHRPVERGAPQGRAHFKGSRLRRGVLYYAGLAAAQGGSTDRRAPAKSSAILRDFCADTDLAARCQRARQSRTHAFRPTEGACPMRTVSVSSGDEERGGQKTTRDRQGPGSHEEAIGCQLSR